MTTAPPTFATRARAAADAVLDVIFPRWCAGCGGMIEAGDFSHLCETCVGDIEFVRAPHCSTCGWPFAGMVGGARRCPNCADLDPAFDQGRTGMLMRGVAREFVHEMKYQRGWHVRADLRKLVRRAEILRDFARGAVLVPVPLHVKRMRWRGFNQAHWVAEALAAETDNARIEELLLRVRDTPTQTRFDRAERERNMKGAFALRPGVKISPEIRYLVVDDVFTTGATLNACAEVLRRAGAQRLDIASLGHG